MAQNREEFLEKVLAGYADNYDITRPDPGSAAGGLPLAAQADLHVSESGFVLNRRAEMWSANSDEYVYFFSVASLTDEMTERALKYVWEHGMSRVDLKGNRNHMCTRVIAVFLCDEAEEQALNRIRRCRLYKSFQFSLKGWIEGHAVAVDLGKESTVSDRSSRETAEFMQKVLHPQREKGKKASRVLGMLKDMLD